MPIHRAGREVEGGGNLQPGFVNECRGLEGLSGFFIGHPDDGQLAQFFIDEREQLIGSFGIARINGAEQLGDVGHVAIMRRRSRKASEDINASALGNGPRTI